MRDEARAARLAELEVSLSISTVFPMFSIPEGHNDSYNKQPNLQRNTFDLLAGQEKVARFESQLKERNSPALYPNHLASAIKYLVQSGKIPL